MKHKWLIAIPLILILLFICAAMVGLLIFPVRQALTSGFHFELPAIVNSLNFQARTGEERSFPVDGPAQLSVDNQIGPVKVQSGDVDAIEVTVKKVAYGVSEADAQKNLENLTVEMTQDGNQVTLKVKTPQAFIVNGVTSGMVDFDITVPSETAVTVDSENGDLTLTGTKRAADLHTSFGAVNVSGLTGGLVVDTRNGRVVVDDVDSGGGDVKLTSDFGDVTLRSSTTGLLKVETQNGAVQVEGVEASGDVTLKSSFGRIDMQDGKAANLTAETQNGEVALKELTVKSKVKAHSEFGGVNLSRVTAAEYAVDSQNGGVQIEGAQGKVTASSDFGNVEVTDGQKATLDLRSKNGAVKYSGSLGDGPHALHSDFGAVTLSVPEGSAFDFDFKTDFGKIKSDFELTFKGVPDEDHWVGKVNEGGSKVTAATQNGNITIEIIK